MDCLRPNGKIRCFFYPVYYPEGEQRVVRECRQYTLRNYIIFDDKGIVQGGKMDCGAFQELEPITADVKEDPKSDRMYLAYDLETFTCPKTGRQIPYAAGIRHGGALSYNDKEPVVKMYYLADYAGESLDARVRDMLWDSVVYLFQPKFIG
jgi:hypothetical protein